jgi:Tol biopolymer transport system component
MDNKCKRDWRSSIIADPVALFLFLALTFLLAACSPDVNIISTSSTISPTHAVTLNTTSTISPWETTLSRLTPTYPPTPSATPMPAIQLTYIAKRIPVANIYSVYAITLGCPEDTPPCLSDPEVLFDIPDLHTPFAASKLSWSPGGTTMVYDAWGEDGGMDIFLINSDGKDRVNLTKGPENGYYPAWSPNGDWISYTPCVIEGCKVFRFKPDGTHRGQLLTLASVHDPSEPGWSPNGKQLTFIGYDENLFPAHIYVAHLDGSSLVQVTHQESRDSYTPAFSPDGRWIVFARDVSVPDNLGGLNPNIFLVKPDGSGETWLAKDVWANQTFPSWSPLGDWIAFNSYNFDENKYDLYIVKSDGTHLINVTNTSRIFEGSPAWRIVRTP